jgi:hypothetical protein
MTKEELIKKLTDLQNDEPESAHSTADDLIIEYINDADIHEAYWLVPKWFA